MDYTEKSGEAPQSCKGAIKFSNVSFAYPRRPAAMVLKDLSLDIEPGKVVAFAGSSGSGKSTIVQLVERFYDPSKGTVTLDGMDLKVLSVSWLRGQLGLVGQEPVLFSGTIMDNVKYGLDGATDEDVKAACKMANADTFIMEFEKGYDTDCGGQVAQLSGGQKQRVAIARAMIKKPSILLLDEATSALDSESEAVVQQALDNLMAANKCTTLVVAHRLSTIQNADKIVVMEKGQVVEQGTHSELMEMNGKYVKLQANAPKE